MGKAGVLCALVVLCALASSALAVSGTPDSLLLLLVRLSMSMRLLIYVSHTHLSTFPLGYNYDAVPSNYTDVPPKDINLVKLK